MELASWGCRLYNLHWMILRQNWIANGILMMRNCIFFRQLEFYNVSLVSSAVSLFLCLWTLDVLCWSWKGLKGLSFLGIKNQLLLVLTYEVPYSVGIASHRISDVMVSFSRVTWFFIVVTHLGYGEKIHGKPFFCDNSHIKKITKCNVNRLM